MRVLIVEDDQETADYICSSLHALGHVYEHAADGKAGFLSALDSDFDVMVIDRMLPGLDGLSLVKSVRSADVATPILFLSAMGGINDRVDGLEAGETLCLLGTIGTAYGTGAQAPDADPRNEIAFGRP